MREPSLEELFPRGIAGKRVHAMGAGGSGISAVVRLARQAGATVTGCDRDESSMLRLLRGQGYEMSAGHDPAHVREADLVVTTSAITFPYPDHPELVAAREAGIPVVLWQLLMGYLMREQTGVSVAGVHGKGTTTGILGALAVAGGLDPTVELGAVMVDWQSNVRVGSGDLFIHEADEFNYQFMSYHPRVLVLTAVEYDHPEFFRDYAHIRDAFVGFARGMSMVPGASDISPTLVLNADDPGCLDVLDQLSPWPGEVRTFSLGSSKADATIEHLRDDTETSFTLHYRGEALGQVRLITPGGHNVANSLAAVAAAGALGVRPEVFVPALNSFKGLKRRFEVIEDGDVTFVDDYAHHPHAVRLTIETARRRFPGRRVVAVFQPTLYTRLYKFLSEFAGSLALADEVVAVEIQPSREFDTEKVHLIHGSALSDAVMKHESFTVRGGQAHYGGDLAETTKLLRSLRHPGDVVLVLGSGPVNRVIAQARATTVG